MTQDLFPKTCKLIERSPHRNELSEFAEWLKGNRYSAHSTHLHLYRLEQVLPRLAAAEPGRARSADELAAVFAVERRSLFDRNGFASTRRAYERLLCAQGQLAPMPASPFSELLDAYDRYLEELRGLSRSTRTHHLSIVERFLTSTATSIHGLAALAQPDVDRFVELQSKQMSRRTMQNVVAFLRAFLHYCGDHGLGCAALGVIDTPRVYRGELPPQALPWPTVQALLASIDHQSKAGWRDHCILHLLSHYGLRPSEVVGLRLDSIDMAAGVLHVVQCKTKSALVLPLAPETRRLLQLYFEHDRLRLQSDDPELFLRARCPYGPLRRHAIGDIFEKRMQFAKLTGPRLRHVYALRHAFAMRLLTRGVGVNTIGDVLGHRSIESTQMYLRLDIDMLRGVALDVPFVDVGGEHA
ncbi:tyrosine-type recombinase/integrase [Variovorax sp. LjRoot178]|uniref:tyrosine-type recombinase/integrase n=1 Tax=Variovorax sp. LjRoot178 TaxID=3342277 RepID=UPI003ECF955D